MPDSTGPLALVTGATGFIGASLCQALMQIGYRVRAFHRPTSPSDLLAGLHLEHAPGDITQPESLAAAMHGVQVVFHTAAMLRARRDDRRMYAITVEGTRNVLQAAAGAGVRRVVHTSSVAALGVPPHAPISSSDPGSNLLMDERHTWNYAPEWWRYGHAKYLAEMEVQEAVARGLDVVIVNPAVVVGAGDINRVTGNVIIRVAQGRVPVAIPGGLNAVHIEDVVRGHLAALNSGRTGERYILGGENLSHLRFLQLIAEIAGVRAPLVRLPAGLAQVLAGPVSVAGRWLPLPVAGSALRRVGLFFYYDTTKARLELGLTNLRPVSQAIEEAIAWYAQRGVLSGWRS